MKPSWVFRGASPFHNVVVAILALAAWANGFFVPFAAGGPFPPQFVPATNFPGGSYPGAMTVGDFNHDGKPDLAVIEPSGVNLLLNHGNGTLGAPTNYPVSSPQYAASGDFNNDGNLDVVVAAAYGGCVMLADGTGNFVARTNFSSRYESPSGVAAGDFNGDGDLDIAVANQFEVTVFLGHGDGSFGAPTDYALTDHPGDVRACDLRATGRLDLVVPLGGYYPAGTNSFCVLLNKGNATFAAPQYYPSTRSGESHYSVELADFNGDTLLDAALLNYLSQSVTIRLSNGDGSFGPPTDYALGFSPTSIAASDFNGDSYTDLFVRGGLSARVLLGHGNGAFTVGEQMSLSSEPHSTHSTAASADLDGDGVPDLVYTDYIGGAVAIRLNRTPPLLSIVPMAGYNQLSWLETFGAGFTLEYTTNLTGLVDWRPFPFPPVLIGNQRAVADWTDSGGKFYRLRSNSSSRVKSGQLAPQLAATQSGGIRRTPNASRDRLHSNLAKPLGSARHPRALVWLDPTRFSVP